jgi:hypothetical protein
MMDSSALAERGLRQRNSGHVPGKRASARGRPREWVSKGESSSLAWRARLGAVNPEQCPPPMALAGEAGQGGTQ